MWRASVCRVLTYNTLPDLGPSQSTNQSHFSVHENALLSPQRVKPIWHLSKLVAHMDGAVGSEGAEGICICCCDIKPAAYRMQPCDLPLAYKHDNGMAMAILRTCLPIPQLMSWAARHFSPSRGNSKGGDLAQSKLLTLYRFWAKVLDRLIMPSLLSSVLYAVEAKRPNIH